MRHPLFASPVLLCLALASCGSGPEIGFSSTTSAGGSTTSAASTGGQGGSGGSSGGGGQTTTDTAAGGATTTSTQSTSMSNNGFPDHWPDGLSCNSEPDFTVWAYDDDTFILRQTLCSNFEGPFLYLLFGQDKVFLQDTGTGDVNAAKAVQGVIGEWLAKKGKDSIPLVVTHSHSHGDHVGGDSQFAGMPNTTVVGTQVSSVQSFFGIANWPEQTVTFELGNRTLDIVPIPGHQKAHVAVYDRSRKLLLTGDSLYPGRLYVSDWASYRTSIDRLVTFVSAPDRPVDWVLGCHIEMTTTPKKDYPMGANKHQSEHPLQLTKDTLLELQKALTALGAAPKYEEHDDFIIYPL